MRIGVALAAVVACLGGCIPKERDFILIPGLVDASGEVAPDSVTMRLTVVWDNGDEAPETTVMVDSRMSVEDDTTQEVLGRIQLDRTSDFDGVVGTGETAEVDYEGTQSPPIAPLDPAQLCDGRTVHLQMQYSTQGSLTDFPQSALSNAFSPTCD